MADNESKPNKGARIAGARAKGEQAALRGKPLSNPYSRPNMANAYSEGYNSVSADLRGSQAKKSKPAAPAVE